MKKLYSYICKKRLIDATIGVLGIILWLRVLALYGVVTHIIYLAINVFGKSLISLDVSYGWGGGSIEFPPIVFNFRLFGILIVNTGERGFSELHKSSNEITAYYEKVRKEEKRLADAAREAGL